MIDQETETWWLQQFVRKVVSTGVEIADEDFEIPDLCPVCEVPEEEGTVRRRRRNSAYADENENWLVSCRACYDEDWQRLEEDWEEYYWLTRP